MNFYASPEHEAVAVRRAAARAGCTVRELGIRNTPAGPRAVGSVDCPDGWAAARMLLASALEDAQTPGARELAAKLRAQVASNDAYARLLQRFVKERVRFVPEVGEIFQNGAYTLAVGYGDCDDHARLVYALALAGELPALLAFLHRGAGPTHAAAQLCPDNACSWAETTVDAEYGEFPIDAAMRLGVVKNRPDLAREVRIMTEKDFPNAPAGYVAANPPELVKHDVEALQALGYIGSCFDAGLASDPAFRDAVANFQEATPGLVVDGLIGPKTRAAIANALTGEERIGYIAATTTKPAKLTTHLSTGFFRELAKWTDRINALGARLKPENFLSVWLGESEVKPWSRHPRLPFGGLNGMAFSYLPAVGFPGTWQEFVALDAEAQLPFVMRYYLNKGPKVLALLDGVTSLYVLNFLPKYISHADDPEFVLAPRDEDKPSNYYVDNVVLDTDRDGKITVADMTRYAATVQRSHDAYWIEMRRRLYESIGGEAPPDPGPAAGLVALALVVGTSAVAAWMAVKG